MRAVVMRDSQLRVTNVAEPPLGPGQLLVEPVAIGICGSDLSAREHTAEFLQAHRDIGELGALFDPDRDLVLGHEFTSRVLEVGDGVEGYAPGDLLVTLPWVIDSRGVMCTVGYSSEYPGALAERVVVGAGGHLKIPSGVSPFTAALTEPMATGVNGVLRSGVGGDAGAIVIGCGPVGLGSIALLSERGVHPLVASDPSALRRAMAVDFGADVAVDPAETDPVTAWRDLADTTRRLFVYEASGRPGMLDALMRTVPRHTRVFVVGACMVADPIQPVIGVIKNLTLEFVGGPGRDESEYLALRETYVRITDGRINAARLITGYTGLEGVPEVFKLLRPRDAHAIEHIKILIKPNLPGADIRSPEQVLS